MTSEDEKYLGTVLVTGGAGIVGSFLVEELAKHPQCKNVVATYHSQKKHQHSCEGVNYHVCDVTDATQVQQLLNETKPTIIIHTISPGPFAPPDVQYNINYEVTKELLRQATESPTIQAFVYTSSVEAVLDKSGLNSKAHTEEDVKLNALDSGTGISAYGRTKAAADALVLAANTGRKINHAGSNYQGQLLTTSLRIGGLYGERDLKTISEMLKCVNTPATRFQIGPDKVTHEWVYTANVAQAHVLAAEALLDGLHTSADKKVDGEAFFVTDDSPMRFWEFSRKVWIAAGDRYLTSTKNPTIIELPFWVIIPAVSAGESLRRFLNTGVHELKLSRHHLEFMKAGCRISVEKAKTRLGYRPICDTEEGIVRSVEWFLKKENEIWFKT